MLQMMLSVNLGQCVYAHVGRGVMHWWVGDQGNTNAIETNQAICHMDYNQAVGHYIEKKRTLKVFRSINEIDTVESLDPLPPSSRDETSSHIYISM